MSGTKGALELSTLTSHFNCGLTMFLAWSIAYPVLGADPVTYEIERERSVERDCLDLYSHSIFKRYKRYGDRAISLYLPAVAQIWMS